MNKPTRRTSRHRSPPSTARVRSHRQSRRRYGHSDQRQPSRPSPPGRGTPPDFPWRVVGLGGGALTFLLLLFFGVRAILGTSASPTPVPTPVLQPTETLTLEIPSTATPTLSPTLVTEAYVPDIPALQQQMFELVNDDRRANALPAVGWDSTAASAGAMHAQEMARFGYLSHWNLEGYGPDYRYTIVGGTDAVMENVYFSTHTVGFGPSSSEEWQALIERAEMSLMNSPAHRANILAPEHTHVGIGIAYDEAKGRLAIAQEFVNSYLRLKPLPHSVSLGDVVSIEGRLNEIVARPLLNVAYEPPPSPMTVTALNSTSTYTSPAQIYEMVNLEVKDDGRFSTELALDYRGQPGLYHVRIWVDMQPEQILATDIVVWVH